MPHRQVWHVFFSLKQSLEAAIILSLLNLVGLNALTGVLVNTDTNPKLDLSIEGMRSQRFGVGVFIFLLIGILVFSGIIYIVLFGKHAPKTMKTGEKVMFAAIIMGVVVAVAFGATQMVSGYLF